MLVMRELNRQKKAPYRRLRWTLWVSRTWFRKELSRHVALHFLKSSAWTSSSTFHRVQMLLNQGCCREHLQLEGKMSEELLTEEARYFRWNPTLSGTSKKFRVLIRRRYMSLFIELLMLLRIGKGGELVDAEKRRRLEELPARAWTISPVRSPSWSWILTRERPGTSARAACSGPANCVRYGMTVEGMKGGRSTDTGIWSRERESRLGAFERKPTTVASRGSEQENCRRRG